MVTIFPDVHKKDEPHYISLESALNRIKSGKQKDVIDRLRSSKDKSLKKKLPVVLFSGEFSERKDDAIIRHSGYIVLDFDHINVEKSKAILASDPFVYACWRSPSGDGLKALVRITNPESHRSHFRALMEYFDKSYGLEVDPTGVNESRACFESYDDNAVIKISTEAFGRLRGENEPAQSAELGTANTDYNKLALASWMIRKSADGEKHQVLLKASVLIGGFIAAGRVEEEEAYRVLEREIEKRGVDDMVHTKRTIKDGIEKGKLMPINETIDSENEAKREARLNDGDMSFISSDSEDYDWICKFKNGDITVGLTTGNSTLDKHFVFKKEFVMLNGHSNVGKTTFVLYLMVSASVNHGWRWVIYTSENRAASVKLRLMQFATNTPIENMNSSQMKRVMEWVSEHFVFIKNEETLTFTELLLYTEKIHRMKAIDGVLVDPYNSLKLGMSGNKGIGPHEYHYEAASEFLTMSNRLNVAVWVNAHTYTAARRIKGNDGHTAAPMPEDTEHGGKWENRSDCFLTAHRKVMHPDIEKRRETEFYVRKVREVETGGEPTGIDDPFVFRFNDNNCGFELYAPEKTLFKPISLNGAGEQLEI